jgi:hypothetical protein
MGKMISLLRTNKDPSCEKYVTPEYPEFGVAQVDLGITPEDVGRVFEARVKLKVRSCTERLVGRPKGKTEEESSSSFEVMEIEMIAPVDKDAPARRPEHDPGKGAKKGMKPEARAFLGTLGKR